MASNKELISRATNQISKLGFKPRTFLLSYLHRICLHKRDQTIRTSAVSAGAHGIVGNLHICEHLGQLAEWEIR